MNRAHPRGNAPRRETSVFAEKIFWLTEAPADRKIVESFSVLFTSDANRHPLHVRTGDQPRQEQASCQGSFGGFAQGRSTAEGI
jgi:hypothetical protein